MFQFRAEELSPGRGVRLVYQSGDTARVILLLIKIPVGNPRRYPFAFQCDEPTQRRPYPLIRVVAAPGVSVVMKSFPLAWIQSRDTPAFEVIRVQDPEAIPPMATGVSTSAYCGREELNPPPEIRPLGMATVPPFASIPSMPGPANFIVRREPSVTYSDTYIRHPYTGTLYRMRVPALTWNEDDNADAKARFAYFIDPDGALGSVRPLLKIVMTGPVEFKWKQGPRRAGDPPETVRALGLCDAFRVEDFSQVPVQGSDGSAWPLHPERPRRGFSTIPRPTVPIDRIRDARTWYPAYAHRDATLREELATALIDLEVGLIPILGDAVDIGEFAYGLLTGKDRWGRTLGVGDLAVMGVGAALPFVSGGALRAAGRLTPLSGPRRAGEFAELIEQLRRVPWSDGDKATLTSLDQLVRQGVRLSNVQTQQFLALMKRAHVEYPAIASLLNASRTGFSHTQLQAAFRRYGRRGEGPVEWALREMRGGALRVLKLLFGTDLRNAARTARRVIDLAAIVRPPGMSAARADALLVTLLRHPDKLFERLGLHLRRIRSRVPAVSASARAFLDEGHFRILKGNIGEILSLQTQLEILKEIQTTHPGARLFTGVRVRLMQGGQLRSPLFSDNIIAVISGGRMEVLAVMEVKSGYGGGAEVQRQIFRWVEGRLYPGSELVLPQGHRILGGPRGEAAFDMRVRFTYGPRQTGTPEVTGLSAAKRYAFIGEGLSHIGVEGERVAGEVIPRHLPATSAEMDWLVGAVLAAFGLG